MVCAGSDSQSPFSFRKSPILLLNWNCGPAWSAKARDASKQS